jgi:hypothetical protein
MQHMNADHKDALILLAKRFAGIEAQEAEMTSVDRLGFHLRLKTDDGVKGTRVGFLREVSDPAVRSRLSFCPKTWRVTGRRCNASNARAAPRHRLTIRTSAPFTK